MDLVNGKVLSLKETYWRAVKILSKKALNVCFGSFLKFLASLHGDTTLLQYVKLGEDRVRLMLVSEFKQLDKTNMLNFLIHHVKIQHLLYFLPNFLNGITIY